MTLRVFFCVGCQRFKPFREAAEDVFNVGYTPRVKMTRDGPVPIGWQQVTQPLLLCETCLPVGVREER